MIYLKYSQMVEIIIKMKKVVTKNMLQKHDSQVKA
jgi:hypothetical protein